MPGRAMWNWKWTRPIKRGTGKKGGIDEKPENYAYASAF